MADQEAAQMTEKDQTVGDVLASFVQRAAPELAARLRAAARLCDRCVTESKGLGSSAPCICGPNVPCDWCTPPDAHSSPGKTGS